MTPRDRFARPSGRVCLLLAGAAAGLAMAAFGTLAPGGESMLAAGEVARVNGVPISSDALDRALAGLASDRRAGEADGERERVLDRLIDEELLVQAGAKVGLVESDPAVRGALVQAMIAALLADPASAQPSEAELAAFFAENRRYFAQPGRARVARLDFADAERARGAGAALDAGQPFETVKASFASSGALAVPDALLPEAKLVELLGPTLARAALALAPGARSDVLEAGGRTVIVVLREREPERLPELDEARPQVEAEWRRREGERALREYLAQSRREAEITR